LITIRVMLLFLVLSFIIGLSFAHGNETITVNKAFNSREIKVRIGGMIQVELEQAGAAGYTWEIKDIDKELFEVVSIKTPESPEMPDLIGGPMKKTWLIRVKAKGNSVLRFIHFRPWEGEEKPADTFFITVRIL